MYKLIADSGSTKTDWVLLKNNKVETAWVTVGFSPSFQTTNDITIELQKSSPPNLPLFDNGSTIYYYGTGCSTEEKKNSVKQALINIFGNVTVTINHDLLAAARALCKTEKGIACILGTGSNSCLYDGNDILENVPSVGYMFGDHGSGAHIGKTFVQAYFDNVIPEHLEKAFEAKGYTKEQIMHHVYKMPMPQRYLASVCQFVGDNISEEFIYNLVKQCFTNFFDHQIQHYKNAKAYSINAVGSIAFYFKDVLIRVAQEKGYKLGTIIKSPMEGLIEYHQYN